MLQTSESSSGVSYCVDQGEDRATEIQIARTNKGADGGHLGLPHIQYQAMDTTAMEAAMVCESHLRGKVKVRRQKVRTKSEKAEAKKGEKPRIT